MRATTRRRQPTTPGEILREEFLIPLGMTQKQLADHLGCDLKVVNTQKAVDLHQAGRRLPSLPKPLLRAG